MWSPFNHHPYCQKWKEFQLQQFVNEDGDIFWVEMLKSVPNRADWEDIRDRNRRKHAFSSRSTHHHTTSLPLKLEIVL